jgi:signal peptidase II
MPAAGSRSRAWALALALAGAVVAIDQLTKQVVISRVTPGDPIDVLFGFELANVRNRGIAFGLLSGGKAPVLAIMLAVLGLMLLYFAFHAQRPGLWEAIGLLSGGALSNLADRIRIGAVIDFLNPPLWPAFNLADVAIVLGVAMLAIMATTPLRSGGRA